VIEVRMLVVTEVRAVDRGFVLAIGRSGCPSPLEWQQDDQKDGCEFAHGGGV
jgi:hypothetical protein